MCFLLRTLEECFKVSTVSIYQHIRSGRTNSLEAEHWSLKMTVLQSGQCVGEVDFTEDMEAEAGF